MPPLSFGHRLDFALIKLVKQNPLLYDGRKPQYTDSEARDEAWSKIAAELNRSANDCKSRWVNIRDQMRRKYRDRLKGNRGAQQKYKYEDVLSFITPHFSKVASASIDSSVASENDAVYFSDVEDSDYGLLDEADSEDDPMDTKEMVQKDIVNMDLGTTSVSEPAASPAQQQQLLNVSDPIDVFLLSIGSTLRKFSPYYQNQAKSKIFQVISEYELKQIMEQRRDKCPLDLNTST